MWTRFTDRTILHFRRLAGLIAAAGVLSATICSGITIGQVDDFNDGNLAGWKWGRNSGGPEIVGEGPAGLSDLQMQNESFGGDDAPGSRMAIINREQWTGNYWDAGVTAIRLDARNLGPNFVYQDMTLRLGFWSTAASTGSGRVVTTVGFPLVRDADWQSVEFSLDELSDFTPIAGSDIQEVMASVTEMRILSAVDPEFIGDQFVARLGIDNITAVPEPAAMALSLVGIGCMLARCSRGNSRNRGVQKLA